MGKDSHQTMHDKEKGHDNGWIYRITREMSYHPIRMCSCTVIIIFLMVFTVIQLGYATITSPTPYDWVIASTEESRNSDALNDAVERTDKLNTQSGVRTQEYEESFIFIHEAKDKKDIYTPQNLLDMCRVESLIALNEDFENYCLLDSNGECVLPSTSIVVHFYGFQNLSQWSCNLLSDAAVEEKSDELYDAMQTPEGQEQYGYWLSKQSTSTGYSTKAQSIWQFGAPLEGYESVSEKEDKQKEEYQKFVTGINGAIDGVEENLLDFFDLSASVDSLFSYYPSPYLLSASENKVEVMWYSVWNVDNEATRVVAADLVFSIFSILFVWTWLCVHTRSLFIASTGMYMIFCSIPCSLLLYKGVYNIPYFSELHILVLFIVLGVGADNIFVLVDSWKQTANMFEGDISDGRDRELTHKRLNYCYEHTISTVFNTSVTTAAAFIATGFSPLMPIATFGWFAATCIVLNFVFVVTLMPPAVVISEMYFYRWVPCLPSSRKIPVKTVNMDEEGERNDVRNSEHAVGSYDSVMLGDPDIMERNDSEKNVVSVIELPTVVGDSEMSPHMGNVEASDVSNKNSNSAIGNESPVVDFYIKFIEASIPLGSGKNAPVVAMVLVAGLFVFGVIGAMYGLELTPPTEVENWYPERHMFTRAQDVLVNGFLGADDSSYETVTFTFGIKGIDRGSFNIYKPGKNRGDAKFDSNWNLAQPACQKAMIRMCDDITTYECRSEACKPTKRIARDNTTECFMKDFRSWAKSTYGEDTYNMSETRFYSTLSNFREEENQKYNAFADWQDEIGFIEGNLKFGSVFFTSTMESQASMKLKQEVASRLDSLVRKVKNYEECDECDCSSLMYSGEYAFSWMKSEEGIVSGFYQGLSIAFPVAFAVLLFATGNVIIALYAILTVFFIVFGVLGFTNYSMHWNLGIAESIAGIIIIGFSVDYTVHLGHMYNEAEAKGLSDKKSKFEMTSHVLLLTVIGGAITTIGAGVFMFACQLIFFVKMAVLIVATILFSWMYSLCFFMPMLYLAGPEGTIGSIPVGVQNIRKYLQNKSIVVSRICPSNLEDTVSDAQNATP